MSLLHFEVVAGEQLAAARKAPSGRSARSIYAGHDKVLRQTVLALVERAELAAHESPGEATLQVLSGRVRLQAGDDLWELFAGDFVAIPPVRHALYAVEDSAVLLTVVKP